MTDRTTGLQKHLDERCEEEVGNIAAVLRGWKRTHPRKQLDEPVYTRWNFGRLRSASNWN